MARRRQEIWTDQYERSEEFEQTYLDRDEFKKYCELLRAVIYKAQRPVCTADIHRELGSKSRQSWTADALASLTADVEEVGVLPTRYRPRPNILAGGIIGSQREYNARLFVETYAPFSQGENS